MSHQNRFVELPEDLQSKIFLRLSVKCVLICKCVCKSFCTIIGSPDFINAHLSFPRPITTETSQSLLLGFIDISRIPFVQGHNSLLSIDDDREILSSSPLNPTIPYVGALSLVGSCNGLICFDVRNGDFTSESNFLLWNPVTRQTRYLPRFENRRKCDFPITEFGFIRETNEYMVVNVSKDRDAQDIDIELYKMSTNSWSINHNTTVGRLIPFFGRGFAINHGKTSVYSNGCLHWGTIYSRGAYILSFNLKNEELEMIKAVDHNRDSYFNCWTLAVVNEDLAMIYWKFTGEFELWVMTDYGVESSWGLKFSFGPCSSLYPLGYWEYDLMIVLLESDYCLLDLNNGEPERIINMSSCSIGRFCSFEESLAPVRYANVLYPS
ncbi:F-box/kelch-repeat protein At3g23880 [Daucus carota subsp. sativus]|uniref:F-box/kelch-repeat protein At3g23880 n=1 Tax=Daucus carota subsp. sativus TaxID=79200 RepID=UPI0007B25554|nr:PREDICTED: F-box/kelch-repeat protein At3g23880-like [Daucus carota subsp. sativus]